MEIGGVECTLENLSDQDKECTAKGLKEVQKWTELQFERGPLKRINYKSRGLLRTSLTHTFQLLEVFYVFHWTYK